MRAKQRYQWKQLSLGTCYYPEQWKPELWRDDLHRMLEAGIRTIRIGGTSGGCPEAEEGEFDFGLFDDFMSVVGETEMKVIVQLPASAQADRADEWDQNTSESSDLISRLAEQIAARYGANPGIIGWQISERNVMRSDILRKYIKPGDFITVDSGEEEFAHHRMMDECLDVLTCDSYPNAAYAFGADPLVPGEMNDRKWSNHLSMVRSVCPHFGVMEQQAGAGSRYSAAPEPAPKPGQMMLWTMQSIAHGADYVGFSRWRTAAGEKASGGNASEGNASGGNASEGNASGGKTADGKKKVGKAAADIYRQGILDPDNRENRRLAELKTIHRRLESLAELAGADYLAAFAVIRDEDNIRDAQLDRWHQEIASRSERDIFRTAQLTHTPMDYLFLSEWTEAEELLRYPVLIYPHPMIMTGKRAGLLREYVEKGGCLVIGAGAGQKDAAGNRVMMPGPGLLRELTGTKVREATFVGPGDEPVYLYSDAEVPWTGIYNEVLAVTSEKTKVLENYMGSTCYYDGAPAMTERRVGEGRVIHYGGLFTRSVTENLLAYTGVRRPYGDLIRLTGECELCVREKNGAVWLIVLNYSDKEQSCLLKKSAVDVDTGKAAGREIRLAAYETKVFRLCGRRGN